MSSSPDLAAPVGGRSSPATRWALLPLLALIALLLGCAPAEPPAALPPAAAHVRVIEAAAEGFSEELQLSATIEAWRIAVLVPQVPGRVQDVAVRIGDSVKEGQVLLTLHAEQYEQGLRQAEAVSRLSEAQLSQARSNQERFAGLQDSGAVTRAQLEEVDLGLQLADAQAAQAKAGLEAASEHLADTRLRAPFSGVIVARNVEQGEMMGGASPLPPLQLADLSRVRVTAAVGELDIAAARPGQTIEVVVEALAGQTFQGTLERVNAAVDPMSRTVEIEAVLENREGLFMHGMTAEMRISGAELSRLAVPRIALVDARDGSGRLFVLDGITARSRAVRYGSSRSDRVPVLEGLEPGDLVLVAGHTRLRDGDVVEVVSEQP